MSGCCCSCICCRLDQDLSDGKSDDEYYEEADYVTTDSNVIYLEPHRPTQLGENPENLEMTHRRSSYAQWNIAIYEDADSQFTELLRDAEAAIENEILPERISQGSSGSYFVKNPDNENIGVFKPKDEEPYGQQNPKWGKWFQRHCCPCCFGRACLIPNTGYLSEAGAYIVDQKLGLCIVPKTKVIQMASTTFHYGKIKRGAAQAKFTLANKFPAVGQRFKRVGLPLKVGSFQVFVNDYKDASKWIQKFDAEPLPPDIANEFQLEFERLVILDYVIRNTDRGSDNWLVKYDKTTSTTENGSAECTINEIDRSPYSLSERDKRRTRRIKIAAIDNGLAFPFTHPNEIRSYPFQWTKLEYAKVPFSKESQDLFLPMLSNISFIEELCRDLYCLFSLDRRFHRHVFEKQMSVLRGQVLNLANALREGKSPLQLSQMKVVRVLRAVDFPLEPPNHMSTSLKESTSLPRTMKISATNTLMFDEEEYKPEFPEESPLFTSW